MMDFGCHFWIPKIVFFAKAATISSVPIVPVSSKAILAAKFLPQALPGTIFDDFGIDFYTFFVISASFFSDFGNAFRT